MPRIKSNRCLLKELLSALLGAAGGDHMVCEFTCSCCGSSTAAAADALCNFLADAAPESVTGFSSRNGFAAVQVGLASRNDAVVRACVRVLAALLQAVLCQRSTAQPGSKPSARGDSCQGWSEQHKSSLQHPGHLELTQQHQQSEVLLLQPHSTNNSNHHQHPPQQQLDVCKSAQPYGNEAVDEQLQLQVSSIASCSWQELLRLLLSTAGAPASSAAVQAAALQELRQLLLQLADSGSPAPSEATGAASLTPGAGGEDDRQALCISSSSSSKYTLAAVREAVLPGVLPLALAALQDEQQELRRVGSQLLAAAVVLQEI